jgi:Spy/CpxP family protein refolding chaperone
VRDKVAAQKEAFEAIYKEEREARQAARATLTEEPFDVAKFKAALDRVAQAYDKETRTRMGLVADTASQLTPEERKQLHAYFEKHRARKRHSHAPPDLPNQ